MEVILNIKPELLQLTELSNIEDHIEAGVVHYRGPDVKKKTIDLRKMLIELHARFCASSIRARNIVNSSEERLRNLVEKHYDPNMTMYGVPLSKFTHEELIAAVNYLSEKK